MDGDNALSRKVREKLTTWKAKAGSIGRWCRRMNSLKRTRSSAKEAGAPVDSCLSQGDSDELENQCGRIFHPFSRLPLELRLEIWRMSWDSRNIGIHVTTQTISVNRESRAETLLHYKPLILALLSLGHLVSKFYFNNELDTLAVYVVGVMRDLDSKLYQTNGGLAHHFLSTAVALRDIRSLTVLPHGGPTATTKWFYLETMKSNCSLTSVFGKTSRVVLMDSSGYRHVKKGSTGNHGSSRSLDWSSGSQYD
ncbi:hypothetical protein BCON_0339g00070 [Botryotinia convoluta]|uniref:2EXR domain-containing protein n=1 Tax=Botryotinia convoluta TaxID=54673 RepID=A0A4Z1HBG6_9HELO|nr:hypothetical protein BCON_0339g00070 [Botryotinia convoluta]